jgi:hypothetical protein
MGGMHPHGKQVSFEPIELSRKVAVTSTNAWLSFYVGRGNRGYGDYRVAVQCEGKDLRGSADQHFDWMQEKWMQKGALRISGGIWELGAYAGREVKLKVIVTPRGFPGHPLPLLYIDQLDIGPETARGKTPEKAKRLVGEWWLRSGKSELHKSYFDGSLSGGDGRIVLADDGTVSVWLRLPTGIQKAGAGYLKDHADGVVFEYSNGDWANDLAVASEDGRTLTLREIGNEDAWILEFTRDDLSSFAGYEGHRWLNAGKSKVHNNVHSGGFDRGSGRLSIGRDGAFTLWLQYPPKPGRQYHNSSSTGRLLLRDGNAILDYDDAAWTDDHITTSGNRRELTVSEKGNEPKWTLVFQ